MGGGGGGIKLNEFCIHSELRAARSNTHTCFWANCSYKLNSDELDSVVL